MKTIKKITVSVTYTVEVSDQQVSENIMDQLNQIVDNGGEVSDNEVEFHDAYYWLHEIANERDAIGYILNIDDIEE